jgi:hypothetical protein
MLKEPAEAETALVPEPKSDGRFKPGQSGNPAGRPPKLQVADIQMNLEKAVRQHFPAQRVIDVVEKTFKEALGVSKQAVACRKLIFEYFIQKPKSPEEAEHSQQGITIRIENATFKAQHEPGDVIDVEATEVTPNG